jgi:hypothetical protein
MSDETTNEEMSDEKLFYVMGERLALLLAASEMTDEVKDAWATMIPKMNLEQLEQLTIKLEASIPDQTDDDTVKLKSDLEEINKKHNESVKKLDDEAAESLKKIEDLLKSKEL